MTRYFAVYSVMAVVVSMAATAFSQDFGQGARRDLLRRIETNDLPQGKASVGGGERLMASGGRSPWHTAGGPKFLYVLEGEMTVEGLGGKVFMTCGPAPKLCFNPHKELFYFRNAGSSPLKFLVIGMDPVSKPTNHELVGQVTGISGNRITVAVGDLRSSDLATPRKEVTVTTGEVGTVAVGDDVVTIRHNEKDHTADRLVKLAQRWR